MKDGVAEEGEGMTRLAYYCFQSKGFHWDKLLQRDDGFHNRRDENHRGRGDEGHRGRDDRLTSSFDEIRFMFQTFIHMNRQTRARRWRSCTSARGSLGRWEIRRDKTIRCQLKAFSGQQRPKRQTPPIPSPAAAPDVTSTTPRQVAIEINNLFQLLPFSTGKGRRGRWYSKASKSCSRKARRRREGRWEGWITNSH